MSHSNTPIKACSCRWDWLDVVIPTHRHGRYDPFPPPLLPRCHCQTDGKGRDECTFHPGGRRRMITGDIHFLQSSHERSHISYTQSCHLPFRDGQIDSSNSRYFLIQHRRLYAIICYVFMERKVLFHAVTDSSNKTGTSSAGLEASDNRLLYCVCKLYAVRTQYVRHKDDDGLSIEHKHIRKGT